MSFDLKKYLQNNPLLVELQTPETLLKTQGQIVGVEEREIDKLGNAVYWVQNPSQQAKKYMEEIDWEPYYESIKVLDAPGESGSLIYFFKDTKGLREAAFKFTDPEVDPHTGAITHTVKYLPNFKKAYDDLEDAKNSISALASKDELISDTQLKRIKDLVKDAFNKYRTHLRSNYRDEYNRIRGRGGVEEMSTSSGAGAYQTPYAFVKKKLKSK